MIAQRRLWCLGPIAAEKDLYIFGVTHKCPRECTIQIRENFIITHFIYIVYFMLMCLQNREGQKIHAAWVDF